MNPVEEVRETERLTTVKSTNVIPGQQLVVNTPTVVRRSWVVGWINSWGGRRTIDVFDRIEKYVLQPQSGGLNTIVLYKDGSVYDTIRNVYSYDLQERVETESITCATTIWQPDRTETFDVEKTVTRTTTTTRMMNVWVASSLTTGVGALISLMIIAGLVALAFFMKPAPSTPPPPAQSAVYQAGPTYVSAPSRMAAPAAPGRGVICFGCGSLIPAGASVCPRCGKPA